MNSFDDIKDLWLSQPTSSVPNLGEIMKQAKKKRKGLIFKNILGISMLCVAFIVIACVVLFAEFRFASTKIGALLVIVSVIGGVFMNSQLLKILLHTANASVDNQAYLMQLLAYRRKQRVFQTKGLGLYFILLSIGLSLYMYEFYARDRTFGVIAYSITMAWVLFNWFYLRPRIIRKQELKINEFIVQIESVSSQLKD